MKRVFLVTGGSSGIGSSIKEVLERAGFAVIAPSHSDLNLADPKSISSFIEQTRSNVKNLSGIIHTASIWHTKTEVYADKPLGEFSAEYIDNVMMVTVTSIMLLVSGLMPKKNQDEFSVIGISGTFADGGKGWLPYYTAKRALEDFLVGLADDYLQAKVFCISPADTATEPFKKFYKEYAGDAQSPTAIADLTLQLIQNETSFNSGQVIEMRDGNARVGYHV